MSVAPSREALEQRRDRRRDQIDCVWWRPSRTCCRRRPPPAMIAEELGATPAAAFDISAACAGFCYGVAIGLGHGARRVRRNTCWSIGVERLSDITDPTDRRTAFIFADGAGAVVVGPSEENGIGPVVWGSDGDKLRPDPPGGVLGSTSIATPTRPRCRTAADGRKPGVPVGVASRWRRSRARRWTGPGSPSTTSTRSSRTRPTCASPTRWLARSSCPSTSRSPATSPTRATPRPHRCRWRWTG